MLRAAAIAGSRLGRPLEVLLVGSGELEPQLRVLAGELKLKVHFPGFVNQSGLVPYYLAMDVLVLPSRRMGETWELVVNEALHAGCSVAVFDAVGCAAEFRPLERFRVFPEGSAQACAQALLELGGFDLSWDWAVASMQEYSIEAAARALAAELP